MEEGLQHVGTSIAVRRTAQQDDESLGECVSFSEGRVRTDSRDRNIIARIRGTNER